jgi:hypothetical protein
MYEIQDHQALKILNWIELRGGALLWESIDLSDPGATAWTPAKTEDEKPYPKPHWKYANEPKVIVTNIKEFEVITAKEVKRLKIAVRMGAQGFRVKLTNASTEKVRRWCRKYENSWYEFDYNSQEAVILVPDKKISLTEWKEANNERSSNQGLQVR